MAWKWIQQTRHTPWDDAAPDPLVDRLQRLLGAGNVAVVRRPGPDAPRCAVYVNTTAVAARALHVLGESGARVIPVLRPPAEPGPGHAPGCVYLCVGRMNALLGVDEASAVAHVQAGSRWRRVEYLLRRRGLTLGPLPAWLLDRSILETFARHDRLRPSPRYGQLTDAALAVAAVLPGGAVARSTVAPRRSTGPDLARMLLGAGHRAGLLTEVHLQAWPLPERSAGRAAVFDGWAAALEGAGAVLRAGVRPAWWRLDRPSPDGPVRLWAGLAGAGDLDALLARFDAAVAPWGRPVDPAPVAEAAAALFPAPGPDPRRGEDLPPPFPTVAWAPRPALARVAEALEGAEVWDLAPEGGTVFARVVPDELKRRRLRDAGAWIGIEGEPAAPDDWATLAGEVAARLAALPPVAPRPEDLPERPLRAGSPF